VTMGEVRAGPLERPKMNEANRCVVVAADMVRARLFVLEPDANLQAGMHLRELENLVNTDYTARGTDAPQVRTERNTSRQAGPVHPQGAERGRHRTELERRFGQDIADRVVVQIRTQKVHALVLVAEPQMLGFLRGPLYDTLERTVHVREWGRNYTNVSPDVLLQRLRSNHLIPALSPAG
jgi:protein required for attachment to host cells